MKTMYQKIRSICVSIVCFQVTNCILQFLFHYFLSLCSKRPVKFEEQGEWIIIVGATNGLGRAFANMFGKKGLNIILIDRKEQDMKDIARDIESKYNIQTKIIPNDFAVTSINYRYIQSQIQDLDIGVLVNNIHENLPHPDLLFNLEDPETLIENLINLNIYSVTSMCKLVLPDMVEKHRGVIINVSSFMADFPTPMLSVYSACKAFVDKFTTVLMAEHQYDGVLVLSLLPGFLDSKWLRTREPSWMAPSPETYLEYAMPLLAVHERTFGYYAHGLLVKFLHILEYISPRHAYDLIYDCISLLRNISRKGYL